MSVVECSVGMSVTPMVSKPKHCNYPPNLPVTNTIIMAFSQGATGGLGIKIGNTMANPSMFVT